MDRTQRHRQTHFRRSCAPVSSFSIHSQLYKASWRRAWKQRPTWNPGEDKHDYGPGNNQFGVGVISQINPKLIDTIFAVLEEDSKKRVSARKVLMPEKAPIDNLRHQQNYKSLQETQVSTPPNPGRNLAKASLTRRTPQQPIPTIDFNWKIPTLMNIRRLRDMTPDPFMELDQYTIVKLRRMQTETHDPMELYQRDL